MLARMPVAIFSLLLSFICLADGSSLIVENSRNQPKYIFSGDDSFEPFSWQDGDNFRGIDVEVIMEMCNRLRWHCDFRLLPWRRTLTKVEQGEVDGGFSAFVTEKRKSYSIFTKYPIHYSTFYLYVKRGKEFPYNTLEDIYGKQIGLSLGFKLSPEFDQAAEEGKFTLVESQSMEDNVRKVIAERIPAFVGNYHATERLLSVMDEHDSVTRHGKPIIPPKGAFLILSKHSTLSSPDKVQLINQTLQAMYDDQSIDRITQKYMAQP